MVCEPGPDPKTTPGPEIKAELEPAVLVTVGEAVDVERASTDEGAVEYTEPAKENADNVFDRWECSVRLPVWVCDDVAVADTIVSGVLERVTAVPL